MSDPDCETGQVIVVVEAPSTKTNVKKGKKTGVASRQSNTELEKKNQRKLITWEVMHKLPSTASFQKWLKRNEAADIKYLRKKTYNSYQGAKDYYTCTGPGCPVQLEVMFDNSCEDVVISHNGTEHRHGEKPHSGWGLPEKIKKEVRQLYEAGISSSTEMDARLRKLGHADSYTLKQLVGYLTRVRRMSRDQETLQEYSHLSVWGGRDRSSQESQEGSYSPLPTDDADFSDGASPPVSPVRQTPTSSRTVKLVTTPQRRQRPAMDDGTLKRLVDSSLAARRHSYSPYSQFPVGAALLCSDGQIVTGCNVENASFGLTNCAERTAVYKAVSEGRREFTAIAVAAEMGDKFVGPCGACRQVLAEFNAEMPVILAKTNGQVTKTNMKELLPMAFLPSEVPFKKQ